MSNIPDQDYGDCYTAKEAMKVLHCKTHSALQRKLKMLNAPMIQCGKPWLIPKAPLLRALKERAA